MEPLIQYARTSDGVSIAYYTLGSGSPAFVRMPPLPVCHLQAEQRLAGDRAFDNNISSLTRLIRYDPRGMGLSDRNVEGFSVDALVEDLRAVVDHVGAAAIILFATAWATPVALAYAARFPEQVFRLLLWSPIARGVDGWNESFDSMVALSKSDWVFASNALLSSAAGWRREDAVLYAEVMREGITPETFQRLVREMRSWNVTELLPSIQAPTLLLHRRGYPFVKVDSVQQIAATIPRCRLALLDGTTIELGEDGAESMASFLNVDLPSSSPTGTAVILFTDIVDSTGLTERMGDEAFRERARALDASLRSIIAEAGGTTIEAKTLGDGVMAVFTSAREAIAAALGCRDAGEAAGLPLHLGVHAGDVIREEDNVYGGAVNIASRIAGASAPGEILVSDTVRSLARTSAGVAFEDRGEHEMKGIADPVRVYAVRGAEGR